MSFTFLGNEEDVRPKYFMKKVILTDRFKQHLPPEFFDEFADVEVITAYSYGEAVKIHLSRKADLIITELYGPDMSTVRFCSLLRGEAGTRGVSIILYCRDNEVERSESAGCKANAVLTLPVDRRLLRGTMQRLLNVPPRRAFQTAFRARRSRIDAFIDCCTLNISVSGMLIEAAADLHHGEQLHFSLALPAAPALAAQAEVVRAARTESPSRGMWYGLRFSRIDPATRRAIERIVSNPSLIQF